MSYVLFVDADSDIMTQYCRAFREKFVISLFSDQDRPLRHKYTHLYGQKANRREVEDYLTKRPCRYVSAAGHGFYDSFTGYNREVVWSANGNLGLLRDAILHLLSCQTGACLGRSMIQQGASAFWGYTVQFAFYRFNSSPGPFTQDDIAEPLIRMDCIIDRGVLRGAKAEKIYASITKYVADVAPQLAEYNRAALLSNYYHLVCPTIRWGSRHATI